MIWAELVICFNIPCTVWEPMQSRCSDRFAMYPKCLTTSREFGGWPWKTQIMFLPTKDYLGQNFSALSQKEAGVLWLQSAIVTLLNTKGAPRTSSNDETSPTAHSRGSLLCTSKFKTFCTYFLSPHVSRTMWFHQLELVSQLQTSSRPEAKQLQQ